MKTPRYWLVLRAVCLDAGVRWPSAEVQFAPPRKWRFDYAWQEEKVALEIQGGVFTQGRHARGAALLREHEKLNAAAMAGYRVLFCTPTTLPQMGETLKTVLIPR